MANSTELIVRTPDRLERLAATALQEHDLAIQAGQSMVEHAIKSGTALLEAKDLVPRGQWVNWLAENVPLSPSVPHIYMRLAKYADEVRAGDPPTIKAARRMLIGRSSTLKSKRDEEQWASDEAEAKRLKATTDMTYRQIAEALGIPTSRVQRWLSPGTEKRRLAKARRRTVAGRAALAREERGKAAKKIGGEVSEAYSLVRRALGKLQAIDTKTPIGKRTRNEAMHRLYDAEQAIGQLAKAEVVEHHGEG